MYKTEEKSNAVTIEEAMELVGQRNRYQVKVAILSFLTWFITTYGYMVIPYFLSEPDFECQSKKGIWFKCTETTGACSSAASRVRMITPKEETISAEFGLYCKNRSLRVLTQSLPLFAGVLGTFFFVWISDRIGRKMAIRACWCLGIISSLVLNLSTGTLNLLVGIFCVGFSALILQNLFIVHINEISIGKFRVMALLGMYIFWSLSEMQYVWMLELFPSWKTNMMVFYTLPFLLCMPFAFTSVDDSPRYLYQKNRQMCLENLNLIARQNDKPEIKDIQLQLYQGDMSVQYNYLDLFRYKSQRANTIIISVIFLFVNFLYQGTQVVLNTVGGSFGMNSFYVGLGELFGFAFSDLIADRVPRRLGIFYSFSVTSLICISFILFPLPKDCMDDGQFCNQKYIQAFLVSLARAITSLTFGLELLLCGEIYPSTMKSLGYGLNLAVGYFGTFLAPSAVDFAKEIDLSPIVFIGLISFFGNFITLLSQETLNVPSTLDIPENQFQLNSEDNEEDNKQEDKNNKLEEQFPRNASNNSRIDLRH